MPAAAMLIRYVQAPFHKPLPFNGYTDLVFVHRLSPPRRKIVKRLFNTNGPPLSGLISGRRPRRDGRRVMASIWPWTIDGTPGTTRPDAKSAATIRVVSNFARAATPHFGVRRSLSTAS